MQDLNFMSLHSKISTNKSQKQKNLNVKCPFLHVEIVATLSGWHLEVNQCFAIASKTYGR